MTRPFRQGNRYLDKGDDYKSYEIDVEDHAGIIVVFGQPKLSEMLIDCLNAHYPDFKPEHLTKGK